MEQRGDRAGKGDRKANVASRDISTLSDLGIPRDRASRAMQLAEVPEDQFEAAHGREIDLGGAGAGRFRYVRIGIGDIATLPGASATPAS